MERTLKLPAGEHVVSVGYPDQPGTMGETSLMVPEESDMSILPVPSISKASSNSEDAANLFDCTVTADLIGTTEIPGMQYHADGQSDPNPVIWTDYGKEIEASGCVYAQRLGGDARLDKVTALKLWFFKDSPPSGTTVPAATPDETIEIPDPQNVALTPYAFRVPHSGRYVVMQFMGKDGNPGGSEFRLTNK